jgi:hypothetical protein
MGVTSTRSDTKFQNTPTPTQVKGKNAINKKRVVTKVTATRETKKHSDIIVVIEKIDISRPATIVRHEVTVTRRPLVARIRSEHALDTHANAFHRLNR